MRQLSAVLLLCLLVHSNDNFLVAEQPSNNFILYFFRHAEKQLDKGSDPELTQAGHLRSIALANFFSKKPDWELPRYFYSTNYKRTVQTIRYTSERLGPHVQYYKPTELPLFAERLLSSQASTLIVGHSNTTPELIELVGGLAEPISESEYGTLYEVTINCDTHTVISTTKRSIGK